MKDKLKVDDPRVEILLDYASSIIATLREPFLVLDKELRIISANEAFYNTFRVVEKDTIGRMIPELGNGQWNNPALIKLLKEVIPEKKVIKDYEVENKFEQIGQRVMLLNACQLRVPKKIVAVIAAGAKEEELILLAIEDVTERTHLKKELEASEERYRRAFETSQDGLLLVDKIKGSILDANTSIKELLGYPDKELLKKRLWEIGVVKDAEDFQAVMLKLEKDGMVHYPDTPVKNINGTSIDTEVFLLNKAKVMQCNIRDITEGKKIQYELKDRMQDLERFSKFAVDRELRMKELEKRIEELEKEQRGQ